MHPVENTACVTRVLFGRAGVGLDPINIVRHNLRGAAIAQLMEARTDRPTAKRISSHNPEKR